MTERADVYERLRVKVKEWIDRGLPVRYRPYAHYILLIPDLVALVARLVVDERVNARGKIALGFALAYQFSPIDLVPDFIPLVGLLDDLVVMAYALNEILVETPEEVVREQWSGEEDVIRTVRGIVAAAGDLVNEKILTAIRAQLRKLGGR